jgi:predicted Rossmann fold flavoprotein
MKIVIIGGGAAGVFASLAAKEANPGAEVLVLERTAKLLSKVRISGGGRCNVTHACFDPRMLVRNYPRGHKELLGPFHRFQPQDTVNWFEQRGVALKEEGDGRIFPVSDSSQTIIDCLLGEAEKLGVVIKTQSKLQSIRKGEKGFDLKISKENDLHADRVILATGSALAGWDFAKGFGHTVVAPVPSLFTFNIPSFPLAGLAGVSVRQAKLKLADGKFEEAGPLLITHWGFSGPGALKLSAFEARFLAEKNYEAALIVDWLPEFSEDWLRGLIEKSRGARQAGSLRIVPLPASLWKKLLDRAGIPQTTLANALSKKAVFQLCESLKRDRYQVKGKTTNKEEFVTCGGVALSEINFKTMESRRAKHLFFCGEILDIDGVTGGFNFQNAWTTGLLAGRAAAE